MPDHQRLLHFPSQERGKNHWWSHCALALFPLDSRGIASLHLSLSPLPPLPLSTALRCSKPGERTFYMAASSSLLAFALVAVVALFIGILFPIAHAQVAAPAPAPTSDGTSIDQGIAYVLMMVALTITYLIHAADASSTCNFF